MNNKLADDLIIRKLTDSENIPFDLLLLADPSKEVIETYLPLATKYIAELDGEILGIFLLIKLDESSIEIKNICVKETYQNRGIGTLMLKKALLIAKEEGYKKMIISTANSSIKQLRLYQRLGFEIIEIKKNFFIENYDEPIFENGTQAKDLIVHCLRL